MTPLRSSDVGEVALSQFVPSVDLTMVPDSPTATKVLFPNPAPQRLLPDPAEVALSKDAPLSSDLTIFPLPTATKVLFLRVTPILKVARVSKCRVSCWKLAWDKDQEIRYHIF